MSVPPAGISTRSVCSIAESGLSGMTRTPAPPTTGLPSTETVVTVKRGSGTALTQRFHRVPAA